MKYLISLAAALLYLSVVTATKQPNIVFIIADDLGWNDVGYHGSEIRTPYIDQLAREGVRLERYYVPPRCGPSRSCLMSGRYQIHLGVQHYNFMSTRPHGLPLGIPTLADAMRHANYSTHLVGKWHLGFYKSACLPTNRGFDSFYGLYTGTSHHYTHCRGFRGRGHVDLRRDTEIDLGKNGTYSGKVFTDEARDIIRQRATQNLLHQTETPFFLVVSHQLPHGPLMAPAEYKKKFRHIRDKNRRTFAAMVNYLDDSVKEIDQELIRTGQANNTVIVFTTDNGARARLGGYNTPLRGEKGTLWEGGVRAVGFVNSPLLANHRKGAELHSLMHMTDWFPTIVGLAGGNVSGLGLDGVDQWPAINDGVEGIRTEVLHNIDHLSKTSGLSSLHQLNTTFDHRMKAAITVGKWKLLTGNPGTSTHFAPDRYRQNPDVELEVGRYKRRVRNRQRKRKNRKQKHDSGKNLWLYDIIADPEERRDLSHIRPEVVRRLLSRLEHHDGNAVTPIWPENDPRSYPPNNGGYWGPYLDHLE